jgi:hypothetical protein
MDMKRKSIFLLASIVVLILSSCMQAPEGEKVETGDVYTIKPYDHGIELKVDLENSSIEWLGTKPTGTHFGTLGIKEGSVFVKDGNILGGKFIMDMNSIVVLDIDNPEMNGNLVRHLKSADFFYVDSFPNAYFEFSKIKAIKNVQGSDAEFNPSHRIEGNLTIRGITKGINFNAKINLNKGILQATTPQFLLNRTNWNVIYGSNSIFANLKDNFIHDEMGVKINLVAN